VVLVMVSLCVAEPSLESSPPVLDGVKFSEVGLTVRLDAPAGEVTVRATVVV
jgi:hypothetical protein